MCNNTRIREQLATIVSCMVTLNRGVCGESFPDNPKEVLDLEIPNMFCLARLVSWKPYRDSIDSKTQREIISEPWNRTINLEDLVSNVVESIISHGIADDVVQRIRDSIFQSDPVVYSTIRRGLAPVEIPVDDPVLVETCRVFEVHMESIRPEISEMYRVFFTQITGKF